MSTSASPVRFTLPDTKTDSPAAFPFFILSNHLSIKRSWLPKGAFDEGLTFQIKNTTENAKAKKHTHSVTMIILLIEIRKWC